MTSTSRIVFTMTQTVLFKRSFPHCTMHLNKVITFEHQQGGAADIALLLLSVILDQFLQKLGVFPKVFGKEECEVQVYKCRKRYVDDAVTKYGFLHTYGKRSEPIHDFAEHLNFSILAQTKAFPWE